MEILGLPQVLRDVRRCLVMGVVNVTPDSFSDGGVWFEPQDGVRRGEQLLAEGADLIDVGGESTRPGAGRIPVEEELRRVLPVVRALAGQGAVVSIDTMRAEVADAALAAGAAIVNDVSGGLADPALAGVAARARVPFVAMHWRGFSDVMESLAVYDDVVVDVRAELTARAAGLVEAGLDPRQIVLDPGFGFAKRAEHGWQLIAHLDELLAIGYPVLVGTSRKRFLAQAVTSPVGARSATSGRDAATAATTVLAALAGAWAVRVHEVAASADAVRVVAQAQQARSERQAGGVTDD